MINHNMEKKVYFNKKGTGYVNKWNLTVWSNRYDAKSYEFKTKKEANLFSATLRRIEKRKNKLK